MVSSEDPSAIMHARRHHYYVDYTAAEHIRRYPEDLNDIGVGLYMIINDALGNFGLRGGEIDLFIHLAIAELCRSGGRPMIAHETEKRWVELPHYGSTPEEIAANVFGEWNARGRPELNWNDMWFRSDKSQ